ncbi:uncharacterized protein LOC119582220 [Penaeus monodon]|uniref:uncharacterized protein LOC119582220 n=1 Tax=Penaeus monodon TaxID=6687 RepID=UPI0018A72681|nr:uncharacterized protein LOC119582220 [Penaeus monodon]
MGFEQIGPECAVLDAQGQHENKRKAVEAAIRSRSAYMDYVTHNIQSLNRAIDISDYQALGEAEAYKGEAKEKILKAYKRFEERTMDSLTVHNSKSIKMTPASSGGVNLAYQIAEVEAKRAAQCELNQQVARAELESFSGDPLKYWSFMRSFDAVVGQTSIGARAKFTRLMQCCEGRASKATAACNQMDPEIGYNRSLQILYEKLGNTLQVKDAWLKQVTEGSTLKSNEKNKLRDPD